MEALITTKKVWDAKEIFKLTTGRQPTDFEELDITFSGWTNEPSLGIVFDNFRIASISSEELKVVSHGTRKPQPIWYEFIFNSSGRFCRARKDTAKSQKLCQVLSGKENGVEFMTSYIDYPL